MDRFQETATLEQWEREIISDLVTGEPLPERPKTIPELIHRADGIHDFIKVRYETEFGTWNEYRESQVQHYFTLLAREICNHAKRN